MRLYLQAPVTWISLNYKHSTLYIKTDTRNILCAKDTAGRRVGGREGGEGGKEEQEEQEEQEEKRRGMVSVELVGEIVESLSRWWCGSFGCSTTTWWNEERMEWYCFAMGSPDVQYERMPMASATCSEPVG